MTEETAPTGASTGIAPAMTAHTVSNAAPAAADASGDGVGVRATIPVSYTHLTLPTIYSV